MTFQKQPCNALLINTLLVSKKIIDKPNRELPLYLINGNKFTTTPTDPTFDHVYETKLPETPVIPSNSPLATPVLV